MIKKHFVVFMSPGTFVSEKTIKSIHSWDVKKAVGMAHKIMERHGARPYGFYFITKSRSAKDLDSKVVAESDMYYLGGVVYTLKEVKKYIKDNKILIQNMEGNGWDRVIVNENSWRITLPFHKGDTLLEFKMKELAI